MMRSWSRGWTAVLLAGCVICTRPSRAASGEFNSTATTQLDSATVSPPAPFPPPAVRRWQVGLLRADRLQHASLAMTLGLAAGLITRSTRIAGYSSLSLGLVKELWDIRENGFDGLDLAADALGAGVAVIGTHAAIH